MARSMIRVGSGVDAHQWARGRKLVLAGVTIPFEFGLAGHSDADIIAHVAADAILGASGKEDIGEYFPSEDSSFKDANSMQLLEQVYSFAQQDGWELVNLDCIAVMQKPKLAPYRNQMRENLATVLKTTVDRVTVRATTTDFLGFVGREEGVFATATCLLEKA